MARLPLPDGDPVAWVGVHLGDLCADEPAASPRFRGGQDSADAALAGFDVAGYASQRNEVWPADRRGASGLSPWIRHGLLTLGEVWDAVADGPARDRAKLRDELLWQEYARHLYARLGPATATALRADPPTGGAAEAWPRDMACIDATLEELHGDGWVVNQARMWLASQWTVRHAADWRRGEDHFFAHLLDGSRAANRLGWQWTVGAATGRAYGFSRRQVQRRAPGLCARCPRSDDCPIERAPPDPTLHRRDADARLRRDPDPDATAGPARPHVASDVEPEAVWLTAESLGRRDPALAAHPDRPAVFVFDEPLLRRLRLSGKRLVFLAESLAGLAADGVDLDVHRGRPTDVMDGRAVAATFAPVPGWRTRAEAIGPVVVHPWPWLRRPGAGPVTSFSAWRRSLGTP